METGIDKKISDTKKQISDVKEKLKLKPDSLALILELVSLKSILAQLETE